MALLIGYITDNLISKYKWARAFYQQMEVHLPFPWAWIFNKIFL